MPAQPFAVPRSEGLALAAERRGSPGGPAVVFLHAGVADRRGWHGVLDLLDGTDLDLLAYDRRGYGETPAGDPTAPFTHLEDLVAVLDAAGIERAVVVGNSMGGALALDLAATAPERVAGLVLLAAAVSGMTDEGEDEPYSAGEAADAILADLQRAEQAADTDEQVRLLLHLWLDGPEQPEGRIGGAARDLAADMNRRILAVAAPEDAGGSGLDTWSRLGAITVPAIVAWGDLDIPGDLVWYERTAERLSEASARLLRGCAHLPSLDRPALVADLVREACRL